MKSISRLLKEIALCALAAGCLWGALAQGRSPQTPVQSRQAAPPDRKIAAQDLLMITITGEAGLQTEFRVSSSGSIQYPFLNLIKALGLTPVELQGALRRELMKDHFVDPQILVTVTQYRQDFVRVIGQVNRPGPVALTGERQVDILDALAMAGGLTRLAKGSVEWTHEGVTRKLSLDRLKTERDPSKRIWLSPGDTIEVAERVF